MNKEFVLAISTKNKFLKINVNNTQVLNKKQDNSSKESEFENNMKLLNNNSKIINKSRKIQFISKKIRKKKAQIIIEKHIPQMIMII